MLELNIDTSGTNKIVLVLFDGQKSYDGVIDTTETRTQMILPQIEEFLLQYHYTINDLTSIKVNQGPGSFTGLRVGSIVAQTISLLCDIPICGLPAGSFPTITYGEDKWSLK